MRPERRTAGWRSEARTGVRGSSGVHQHSRLSGTTKRVRVIDRDQDFALRQHRLHEVQHRSPQHREPERRIRAVLRKRGLALNASCKLTQSPVRGRRAADRTRQRKQVRQEIEQPGQRPFSARRARAVFDATDAPQRRDAHTLVEQPSLAYPGFARQGKNTRPGNAARDPRRQLPEDIGSTCERYLPERSGTRPLRQLENASSQRGCRSYCLPSSDAQSVLVEDAQRLAPAPGDGK